MTNNLTNEERIALIKWGCKYAEGFELGHGRTVHNPSGYYDIVEMANHKNIYPLFLQRAIEGMNNTLKGYFLSQDSQGIVVWYHDKPDKITLFNDHDFDSIDNCKEFALKYIMDQEAKDE